MPSRHDLRHWAGFPHSPGDCPDQPWICTTTIMPPVSHTSHCTSNSCEHRHATMLLWNPLSIWHRSLWHKIVPKSSKKDIYNRHSVLRNISIFLWIGKIFEYLLILCRYAAPPPGCVGGDQLGSYYGSPGDQGAPWVTQWSLTTFIKPHKSSQQSEMRALSPILSQNPTSGVRTRKI